jgi:aldose 1-epimerase
MDQYAVTRSTREGQPTITLRDGASGATAEIWPGCGVNCFSLTLPLPSGASGAGGAGGAGEASNRPVTVIKAPPSLEEIRRKPSWWGIPLLFPFPGSIPDGEYVFEGRRLRLGRSGQPVVAEGNEIPGARRSFHGFVMDAPWTVEGTTADDSGASVRCTLSTEDLPEMMDGFPFPFRVVATYRLHGARLELQFDVQNTGPGHLPFGFGAHPFFHLPLGAHGTPGDCRVYIPAARRWDGRRLRTVMSDESRAPISWDEICPPVPPEADLRTPKPFVEGAYNGVYTDLTLEEGRTVAAVVDAPNGIAAVVDASPQFGNVVFWSPPERNDLCLEPWTCPPNAFNLAARGVPHDGVTVLPAGEFTSLTLSISLRPANAIG